MKKWLDYMYKKVILPMRRRQKNKYYLARSNALGMGLAFAPFPGQVPLVLLIWIIARKLKWRFSLAIAIAWTFISNIFTNIPLFYLYYKTGIFFRNAQNLYNYEDIKSFFNRDFFNGIYFIATEIGVNILLGSLLYMLIFGGFGYLLGLASYYHSLSKVDEKEATD